MPTCPPPPPQVKARKEGSQAAKVKAESDYANARTQQEAERAEKALRDAIKHFKVRLQCGWWGGGGGGGM